MSYIQRKEQIMKYIEKHPMIMIVVGILGMCMMGIAYPVYQKVTKIQKEKIGPQILALTEEM